MGKDLAKPHSDLLRPIRFTPYLQWCPMPRRSALLVALTAAIALTACTSDGDETLSNDQYLSALGDVCTETRQLLDALPEPPQQISTANFAAEAASALVNEAARVRQIVAPEEIAADHRAFIANTEAQADAWRKLGSLPETDADALEEVVTSIGQLTLGRDDLAAEMGASACVRAP